MALVSSRKGQRKSRCPVLGTFGTNVPYLYVRNERPLSLWGHGTIKIVENCIEQDLPEPDFVEEHGVMTVTFYKDKLNKENLKKLGLNERQIKAVTYVKEKSEITNRKYQNINTVSNKTAYLELSNLVKKDIFKVLGKGKSVSYALKVTEK